jgi:7-keto-8-aminopelargonate synthetase-like enzyme
MKKITPKIDVIDEVIGYGVKKGVIHLNTTNQKLYGNKLLLDKNGNKEVINFGSCSYLGLEFDERIRQASKDAIDNYGTQFSSSRAYISPIFYQELESLFCKIFDAHAIVTSTSTLGHIGAIPVLVGDSDAIILDQQVHNSVQTAVSLVKSKGVYTELIRHNRMDLLEERIKILRQKHSRIWYMADGVYSMYGDVTPVSDIYDLMNRYPELYYYVDDAHGMSCFGEHGRGYALAQKPIHEKMVLITSLAKAFATGGGVAVFPTKELARKFRTCAGPMITSGPMQPAGLGAAIASAKIHLSNEIYELQEGLHENIKYTELALKKYGLPLVSATGAPIFFVAAGLPKIGFNIISRMLNDGYYVNAGVFPAVPIKNTGIRFTITKLHTFREIENMVAALAYHHAEVLKEENFPIGKVYQAFKMKEPIEQKMQEIIVTHENQSKLNIQHTSSIKDIDIQEWNSLLGGRGSYDWNGLNFLERSYYGNSRPENNWKFDYIIIRDEIGKPILATFLTTAIWKDDMMAPEGVSVQVEAKRKAMNDPYYLTSKLVSMGSLLTEGDHLYVDRTSPYWKEAINILLETIAQLQEKYQAAGTLLRDLKQGDEEMDAFLMDNGYFKLGMPATHVVEPLNWTNEDGFLSRLSKKSRRHMREGVLRYTDCYEVNIVKNATPEEIQHWYSLYMNVKSKSLLLNTFDLPYKLFESMASDANWEVMTLTLKKEHDIREERKPVIVVFSYVTKEKYNPMIMGVDYAFQEKYKCYKQALYQLIERGRILGKEAVNLGLSASIEKQKYGAKVIDIVAYMQAKDNYSLEVVSAMNMMEVATK